MAETNLARLGGICGLLAVLSIVPAYLVGYPDAPGSQAEATLYFLDKFDSFLLSNGTLPVFHVFFFLLFLGVLVGILREAEGRSSVLSSAALAGGVVFVTLSAAGFAAEILLPATVDRFGDVDSQVPLASVSLALSAWLYHFCQAGAAVLVLATSLVALGTGILPRWLGFAGFIVTVLALLHFVLPLVAALAGLAWIAVVSVILMLGVNARRTGARRPARR